jgi:hypothetical protein
VGAVTGRSDDESSITGAGFPHGFQAIEHQVQHDLLPLDPVAGYARLVGGQLQALRHVANDGVIPYQPRHFTVQDRPS